MARRSPRRASPEQEPYQIVLVEVDQQLTCLTTARISGCWFYVEARTEHIRSRKLKDEYNRLAQRVVDERNGEELVQETERHDSAATDGSGAQLSAGSKKTGDSRTSLSPAETDLAQYLLPALTSRFEEVRSSRKQKGPCSVQDWYNAPITCLEVIASASAASLQVTERDDLDGEMYLHKTLTPNMNLPKDLRSLSHVPWYSPADLRVLVESHDIHMPLHPTIVQPTTNGASQKYFLKLATQDDSPSVIRELKTLSDLRKYGLHGKGVRAPQLAGLVSLPSTPGSHTKILGFLLGLVPQPSRPLLSYMDEEVAQSKRNGWAREAASMVRLLHEHNIIWGDAKGDNFLVDAHGKLWIIDFGGSYTEGWVDKRHAGTKKGDDEGLNKLINGVKDPESFIEDEENKESASANSQETKSRAQKRSREGNGSPRKRSSKKTRRT